MTRQCGTCGNTQGPFDRIFVGFRKTGMWLFYCQTPKKLTGEEAAKYSVACYQRFEKNAAA
jgi:hypothetical protein